MFVKQIWYFLSRFLMTSILLAACSLPARQVEERSEESRATKTSFVERLEEPTTPLSGNITLWHSLEEGSREGLNLTVAAFNRRNRFINVEVVYIPSDEIRGKFEMSTANGDGPALLIGPADWGPAFYTAELIADVAPLVESTILKTLNRAALDSTSYDDKIIGLPFSLEGIVLLRNNRIIAEAPTRVEDLISSAQRATSGKIIGAYLERGFFFSAGHLYALGGKLMNANGDAMFNDEKGIAWLNLLKSFSEAGPTEYYGEQDVSLFKQGNVGMIIDVSGNMDAIAKAIGEEHLSVDPWPAGMSGFVQCENVYMSINAEGDNKVAAWEFMEFMLTPEAQAILAENNPNFIPAALGTKLPDRLRQEVLSAFEDGVSFPVIPEVGAYWGPMDTALKMVFYEGADPASVLQQAFDSVNADIAIIRGRN